MFQYLNNPKLLLPPPTWRNLFVCFALGLLVAFTLHQLVGSLNLASADSSILLSIDSASAVAPGASVDLNVYIDPTNAPKQPTGIGWDVLYNSADVTSIVWKSNGPVAVAAGKFGQCATPAIGDFRCIVIGFNTTEIAKGVLGTITVNLAASTSAVTIPLQFSRLSATDAAADSLTVIATNGSIGVGQPQQEPVVCHLNSNSTVDGSATGLSNAVNYSATGGNGSFAWLASNATPPSGTGNTFSTQFNAGVTSGTVSVNNVPCPTIIINIPPSPVNGICGSANGGTFDSAPSGSSLCNIGTASTVSGSGPWTWTCSGSNNGSNASCSATKTVPACVQPTTGSINAPSTVDSNQSFNLTCDFGSANDYIVTPSGCSFVSRTGSAANFTCTAPASGSVTYTCQAQNQNNHTNFCVLPQPVSKTITVSNPQPVTYTATVSATASATANCSNGTVTSATATDFATATSNISQQDAQNQAQAQAQTKAQAQAAAQAAANCPNTLPVSTNYTNSFNTTKNYNYCVNNSCNSTNNNWAAYNGNQYPNGVVFTPPNFSNIPNNGNIILPPFWPSPMPFPPLPDWFGAPRFSY